MKLALILLAVMVMMLMTFCLGEIMKLALILLSLMTMMLTTMRETSGDPKTYLVQTADHENQGFFFNLN